MQQNPHSVIRLMNPDTLYNPSPFAYSHIAQVNLHHLSRIVHIAGQGGELRSKLWPLTLLYSLRKPCVMCNRL